MPNGNKPAFDVKFTVKPPGNGDVVVDELLPHPSFEGLTKAMEKANAGTGHDDFLSVDPVNGLFSGTDGGLLDL